MTSVPGPPGPPTDPPYGPPPYGGTPYGPPAYGGPPYGPARGSSTATVVTALLAVLFVLATVLVAWGVHSEGNNSTSSAGTQAGLGLRGSALPSGSTSGGTAGPPGSLPTSSVPSPSVRTYVPPPPVPSPTHQPLDPEAVNRTFQVYMNALLYRSLSQLRSATCPKLRHTETGTALDHKYINRWQGHTYTIYNSLDYVIISATVRYVNPNTGGNGGQHTYRWYVDRFADGHYWVCGIL